MENGSMMKVMEEVFLLGLMIVNMMENIKMIKRMKQAFTMMQTETLWNEEFG